MEFSMSLATQVMLEELMKKKGGSSKNVVVSPVSISMVLNMLASGLAGKTLDQFLEILGSENADDLNTESSTIMRLLAPSSDGSNDTVAPPRFPSSHYKLFLDMHRIAPRTRSPMSYVSNRHRQYEEEPSIPKKPEKKGLVFNVVNALWVDHRFPLIPSFQKMAITTYKARVENVDFELEGERVKKAVNSWTEKETKGLIKEIEPPGSKLEPPLCLVNALYFRGDWESPFRASKTCHKDFHLLDGETIKAPFMIKEDAYYNSYGEFKDFKLLQLPYESDQGMNKRFSMYIFLPHAKNGLEELIKKFNSDPTMLQPKRFRLQRETLSPLWIPKMKLSYDFNMKRLMKEKGLTLLFDPLDADFTEMVYSPFDNVYVGSILHKACIEVNEKGTEAAAVTVGKTYTRAAQAKRECHFVADHPFLFMIVEDSLNLIVFTGIFVNPLLD